MKESIRTHFPSGSIVPRTFTLYFHFFALQPVWRSHSLSVSFFGPHDRHLHTTLKEKGQNISLAQLFFRIFYSKQLCHKPK